MKFIKVILLICFPLGIIAQTIPVDNITTSNGLADNKTYKIVSDNEGYLWIATDNGLCKYDGTTFKTFTTKHGLKSPIITSIAFHNDSLLIIECFRQGVMFFNIKQNRAHEIGVNVPTNLIYDEIAKYKRGSYLINKQFKKRIYRIEKGNNGFLDNSSENNCLYSYNDTLFIGRADGLYYLSQDNQPKLKIKTSSPVYSIAMLDTQVWLGSKGKIYIINNQFDIDSIISPLFNNANISLLSLDSRNNLWISKNGRGLFYTQQGKIIELLDNSILVSGIYADKQGFVWVPTYGNGIYKFYNSYIKDYTKNIDIKVKSTTRIDKLDNNIAVGFAGFLTIQNSVGDFDDFKSIPLVPRKFLRLGNDYVIIGQFIANNIPAFIKHNNKRFYLINGTYGFVKNDSTITVGTYAAVENHVLKNGKFSLAETFTFDDKSIDRVNTMIKLGDTLLIATTGPLYLYYNNNFHKATTEYLSIINDVFIDNNKNIWYASGYGLFRSHQGRPIDQPDKIIDGSFSAVTAINNDIWAGSSKGVYIITKKDTLLLDKGQGMPGSIIGNLLYDSENRQIWIGADKGLCKININEFDNIQFSPIKKISFDRVTSGDSSYNSQQVVTLNHKNSYLKIHFTALNYSSAGNVVFEFRLDEGEWVETKDKDLILNLSSLKFGNHKISVRGKNPNSDWTYSEPLLFYIITPFHKSFSFYILIICGGLLIIFVIVYNRVSLARKRQAEELEFEKKMNQLQNMALSAMMNPHFIFNCLSSIQFLVNTSKIDLANTYISKLARLIRMNLTDANEDNIPLNRELDRAELYIKLEQMRFEDKFDYSINISDNIDAQSLIIPSLIIQPIIENSIKHGILPLQKVGTIMVNISDVKGTINIDVIDNGIGLDNSISSNHQSMGLYIIKERISLFNNNEIENEFEIESRNEQGITGTVVKIRLKRVFTDDEV